MKGLAISLFTVLLVGCNINPFRPDSVVIYHFSVEEVTNSSDGRKIVSFFYAVKANNCVVVLFKGQDSSTDNLVAVAGVPVTTEGREQLFFHHTSHDYLLELECFDKLDSRKGVLEKRTFSINN